ncbi:MAG: FecR domain-containing protein [Alphaproteobacteria bacterium]|nr:FecR domain-containing protein [Alphaproteobacteria bacterium]
MRALFRRFSHAVLLGLLLLAPTGNAHAADDIAGTLTRLKGAAIAMQDAIPRPLKVGDAIRRGDVISTGPGARLEMRMQDDAVMTLGEKTIFIVIDYITGGQEPNAAMRLMQGAFSAVSGKMMKTAGAKFTVASEAATIGIRGTTFWGGILDGVFQVAMLDGKAVIVENRAGRVVIDRVNDGTKIADADTAPTKPKKWGGVMLNRAIATVAF